MKRTQDNSINLYESYIQRTKKEQGGKSGKRITWTLPVALLLLVLLGLSGRLLLQNAEKQRQLAALDEEIATLSAAYDSEQSLETRRNETATAYESLANARFMFELYPALTQELFKQVRECAADIFNISQYAFDERTGVLTINASAASVNEVPLFVQRLRDTELFSLVQYTGYTSSDTTEYFCAVSCTLLNESAFDFDGLLQAASADAETDGATDAGVETVDELAGA